MEVKERSHFVISEADGRRRRRGRNPGPFQADRLLVESGLLTT